MSQSRRIMRLVRRRAPRPRVTVLEGYKLSHRLAVAARQAGAQDPLHYLEYLRQQRRGYSAQHDGPSELMRLVDDIADYEVRESDRQRREAG